MIKWADNNRPDRTLEWVGLSIIFVAGVLAPGFPAEDPAIFFNYVNNVPSPNIVYSYGGYVQLVPQLTAYAVEPLPFSIQMLLYRVVALGSLYILYREVKTLLRCTSTNLDAVCAALGCIFYLYFLEPYTSSSLAYSIWTGLLAGLIYVFRVQTTGSQYSVLGVAGLLIAALSHPGGLLAVPMFLYAAWGSTGRRRATGLLVAATILCWYVVWTWYAPTQEHRLHMSDLYSVFLSAFWGPDKRFAILALVSILALATTCVYFFVIRDSYGLKLSLWLSYIGSGTIAMYVLSPRFAAYGGFPVRYIMILAVTSFLAVSLWVMRRFIGEVHSIYIGGFLGFSLALLLGGVITRGRGPLLETADLIRFFNAASDYRATCAPGDKAFGYVSNVSAPVVLCRKIELPKGMTSITNIKYWTMPWGRDSPLAENNPRIYVAP